MNKEKHIFNLLDLFFLTYGEKPYRKFHVLNHTEVELQHYRLYHGDGYCWDVKKDLIFELDELEEIPDDKLSLENGDYYYFTFSEEWDGFKKSGIDLAIELLKEVL